MRRQDAQDILRMVESLWAFDLGAATRDAWRPVIEEYDDAALVTEAIISLGKQEVYRPSLALIGQAVARLQKNRRVIEQPPDLPQEIPWARSEIPLWVKRWFYARFRQVPPDLRPFPEQRHDMEGEPKEWMPDDAYVEEAKTIKLSDVQGAFAGGRHM